MRVGSGGMDKHKKVKNYFFVFIKLMRTLAKINVKNWPKKIFSFLVVGCVLLTPILSLAITTGGGGAVQQGLDNPELKSQFGSGGLLDVRDAPSLITKIIGILLALAFAIAIVFLIIGGYQYVTSAGNEEQAEKGKKTLINAIIGITIIILAYVIVSVIVNLVARSPGR